MRVFVTDRKVQQMRRMAQEILLSTQMNRRLVAVGNLRHFCGVAVPLTLALPMAKFYTRSLYWDMSLARLSAGERGKSHARHSSFRSSDFPQSSPFEANRVEFLKKVVRDEQWALSTMESHMTTPMNFNTFHTRLSSAIVHHEELATRNAPARPTVYTAQVISTYYGEQYARITTPPRRSNATPAQSPGNSNTDTPGKKALICWNCGEAGHPNHLCPQLTIRRSSDVLRDQIMAGGGA
jgi:hypothetical protein